MNTKNSIYKSILTLAIPVIISQVGQVLVGLVDTLMVGQLGAVPLAGVSFANAIFMTFVVAGMGFAMGLTPLVSRAAVRSNDERVRSLFKNSFVANTLLGVGFVAILALLIFLMPYMGQDPEVLEIAVPYTWLMLLSILPNMWMYTIRQFLEGLGNTFWAMVATISSNVINVGLNFVFIYGLCGMPEMGAIGVGVATLVSRVLMTIFMVLVMWIHRDYRGYLKGIMAVRVLRFRLLRLWRMGYPIALQLGIECGSFGAIAVAIGTFGAVSLAGHQIAVNMPTTAFMVVTGVANATMVLVARNYEMRLYAEVRRILSASLRIVTVFMALTAVLFLVFAMDIASLFSPDVAVQEVASYLLIFAAVFQLSDGIQGVTLGALRGLLDVKKTMTYTFFSYIVVGIPVAYLCGFVFGMGAGGIWLGLVSALTLLAVLYIRRFRKLLR
ncbi:MAG: MATE family efflux transporter [Rikenellaceae bacterium]